MKFKYGEDAKKIHPMLKIARNITQGDEVKRVITAAVKKPNPRSVINTKTTFSRNDTGRLPGFSPNQIDLCQSQPQYCPPITNNITGNPTRNQNS